MELLVESPTVAKSGQRVMSISPYHLKKCLSFNDILMTSTPQTPVDNSLSTFCAHDNQSPLPKFELELEDDQEEECELQLKKSSQTIKQLLQQQQQQQQHHHPQLATNLKSINGNNLNNTITAADTQPPIITPPPQLQPSNSCGSIRHTLYMPKLDTDSSQNTPNESCSSSPSSSSNRTFFSSTASTTNESPRNRLITTNQQQQQQSLCSSVSPLANSSVYGISPSKTVLLRVKLPLSHPLISKVFRFPLHFTISEMMDQVHKMVRLENRVNLIIVHKQSILPHNHPLSNYFVNDDGILPLVEVREITSLSSTKPTVLSNTTCQSANNNPQATNTPPRPKLLHSSSFKNLLNSMPNPQTNRKRNSNTKDSFLFQPPLPSYTTELDNLFWIHSPDQHTKVIPCLHLKWRSSDGQDSKYTILYSGGDREDLGLVRKSLRILSDILLCNIICYDYTGFGLNSSGKPTMKELLNDISIVYNYCINNLSIPSSNIILMAKSIGTICSLQFAGELYPRQTSRTNIGYGSIGRSQKKPVVVVHTPTKEESATKQPLGGLILLSTFVPNSISENIVNIKGAKKLSKQFQNLFKYIPVKDASHWNLDSAYLDDYDDHIIDFLKSISPESFNRKERELPSSYAMSPSKVVGSWLHRLNLGEYTDSFLAAGYFEMASIASLDKNMLELLGIEEQHMSTLLEAISKIPNNRHSSGSSSGSGVVSSTSSSSSSSAEDL
ncbi:hypothetical protein SAMD00019534_118830, partial [Acytostelium subglobosum LB1]|uniref:hypothetical protein n=1 Tax=Acytostelium subglobosum LB1 TaxID=1410327 RepID=UPI000644EFC3